MVRTSFLIGRQATTTLGKQRVPERWPDGRASPAEHRAIWLATRI